MNPRSVEVWSRPDDPGGFRALLELELAEATLNDRDDVPGTGVVSVNPEYEYLDQILNSDPSDVPAAIATLIAVFREDSPDVPDFEFFPDERVDPIGPGLTTISGPDIRSALNDGQVRPRTPTDPIWLWGAPTLTRNPDLTEGTIADEEFDVWIVGGIAGDTWRIDLGASGWSAAIDYDATGADVKAAIEAGPSSVVEVNVTGDGTLEVPWKVHIVNPAQTDYTVQVDDADITGDIFVQFLYDGGDVKATYYTPAQTVEGDLFGVQGTWRVEIDSFDGLPSILVAGNSAFIGVQQILEGVGGVEGYATVEFRPLVYGANFRLGIRDIDESWLYTSEEFIDEGVGYEEIRIDGFTLAAIYDTIILRAAVIDDAPPDFYVRNLRFHPGKPATTWGDIVHTLVPVAQARGVLLWLDISSSDATTDSNDDTWDTDQLAWRADPGMELGTHLMVEGQQSGYEYEIVRKATPVGALTHDLKIYNSGGKGTVKATDPAVIIGDITKGHVAKRRVPFTHLLVEYGEFQFVEVTHADFAAMPRREAFIRADQATDEFTANKIGEQYIADQIDNLLATQVEPTSIDPYRDVRIGDTIPYELGDIATSHSRRIHTITTKYSGDVWRTELTASRLFPTSGDGMAAVWESIRQIYALFDRRNKRQVPKVVLPQLAGGSGGPVTEVIIAAADTNFELKALADYVCTGTDDQDTWYTMIQEMGLYTDFDLQGTRCVVKVLDGTYQFDSWLVIDAHAYGKIKFIGEGMPTIFMNFNTVDPVDSGFCHLFRIDGGAVVDYDWPLTFDSIRFDGNNQSIGWCFFSRTLGHKPLMIVRNCMFTNWSIGLWWSERGSPRMFHNNQIINSDFTDAAFSFQGFTVRKNLIYDNIFQGCSGDMVSGGTFADHAVFEGNVQDDGTMVLNALAGVNYGTNWFF